MTLLVSRRTLRMVALVSAMAALLLLAWPSPGEALPDYATKTGQSCTTCHNNPAGGSSLTSRGRAFKAVGGYATNPAGAWAQVSAAASPTATTASASTATPRPTTVPVPEGPASATFTFDPSGKSVVYSITVANSSGQDLTGVFVAGSIPDGADFAGAITAPAGAVFRGAQGGLAAWTVSAIPAGATVGPFTYELSKDGRDGPRAAVAFVHWNGPTEGAAASLQASRAHEERDRDRDDEDDENDEDDEDRDEGPRATATPTPVLDTGASATATPVPTALESRGRSRDDDDERGEDRRDSDRERERDRDRERERERERDR